MKRVLLKNENKNFKEKLIKILTNKKLIYFIVLLLFVYIVFNVFKQFGVVISFDSTNYYSYLEIFNGKRGLGTWDIERGFSFPLIIFIITKIFGNTGSGYLNGIFILYISMILIILYFINYLIKYNKIEKKKSMYYLLFVFLILLNPIIFGWSHYMLTEAVAPPIYFLCLLCCFKMFNYDLKKDKIKIIISTIFLSLMSILLWFLKQPYAPFLWMMLIMNAILTGVSQRNFKRFLKYIGVFLIVILSTLLSIKIWNTCLYKSNPEILEGKTSTFYFQRNLFEGINYHVKLLEKENYCSIKFIDKMKLSKRRKENIYSLIENNENWCNYLRVYEVTNLNNKLYKHEYLITTADFPTTKQSLLFTAKLWVRYPMIQMDTLFKSYLSIIDLHNTSDKFKATGVFNGNANKEMNSSFYSLSYKNPNTWWQVNKDNPEYQKYFTDSMKGYIKNLKGYESVTTNSSFWSNFMMLFEESSMLYFKLVLLFCLPIAIYSFIRFIKYSKSKAYYLITLISFSSFAHIMFHVIMGAIIDRYAYPVYPLMLLALIIMFMQNNDDKDFINVSVGSEKMSKKENQIKIQKKDEDKVLFVIPAYNEAENIGKVLDEIQKEVSFADILVVNDCSTDNTYEIVKSKSVLCITNVFNMKYAMAVQTGIKYANDNDYDYVIQFDADGQHIASEAIKLYKEMKKGNYDIVIGSRYLKDMGYACPLFRRIGTKIFEWIIRYLCKEKIVDPLSGFQCLNKRTIKKYSKMGNYPEYPDANLVIEMLRSGYRIKEVPVKMRLRESGESMHGGIIKPIKYMIEMIYSIVFVIIQTPMKKER